MSCAQARCGTQIRLSPGWSRVPASMRRRSSRQAVGGRPDGTPASWSRAVTKSRRASASHSAHVDPPHRPEETENCNAASANYATDSGLAPRAHGPASVARSARRALSRPAPANPYLGRDQRRSRLASAGDELLEDADGASTRAITIDAPEASVWPWLAQMGPSPRGGAYTYDWIENLLGLDMHSADHVLPEFQHPEVGDTIGLGSNRMRLERAEPGHVLALALRRRKLGVDVRAERARRHHPADQPQPLPPPDARRPCRHVAHGAGVALDG